MVALPDGTYLILNGAYQGFAGFGLANDPNLNAVSQPSQAPELHTDTSRFYMTPPNASAPA